MKRVPVLLLAALLVCVVPGVLPARPVRPYSSQELYNGADLVVLAKPSDVLKTGESFTFPTWKTPQVGMVATFEVGAVLKGDKTAKQILFHYYRPDDAYPNPSGPKLLFFDPAAPSVYLLFLVQEKDGRYGPVSGAENWADISVVRLDSNLIQP